MSLVSTWLRGPRRRSEVFFRRDHSLQCFLFLSCALPTQYPTRQVGARMSSREYPGESRHSHLQPRSSDLTNFIRILALTIIPVPARRPEDMFSRPSADDRHEEFSREDAKRTTLNQVRQRLRDSTITPDDHHCRTQLTLCLLCRARRAYSSRTQCFGQAWWTESTQT